MSEIQEEKEIIISLDEYENLKQIKQDRLDELQSEIYNLQTQMLSEKIDSIIKHIINV